MFIVYPVLGVLMIGLMGFCFSMGIYGMLLVLEMEKDRKEGENKVG